MCNYLSDKDISVVIQGPINPEHFKRCISSVAKYFPNAEVILSTWPHQNYHSFGGWHHLIENDDPGPNILGGNGIRNLNRQIVTTVAGIRASTRKYVIKIRSDIAFIHNKLLGYYPIWNQKGKYYRIFDQRIAVTNAYTLRSSDRPVYVSDFVYMSTKDNLLKLFDLPTPDSLAGAEIINGVGSTLDNVGGEQYLATGYFQKVYGPKIISSEESDIILGNNFVVLDMQRQFGVICLKYPYYKENWHPTMLTHFEWQQLYYKYGRTLK